jgi:hypothetical protein
VEYKYGMAVALSRVAEVEIRDMGRFWIDSEGKSSRRCGSSGRT